MTAPSPAVPGESEDTRLDLILRVQEDHRMASAGIQHDKVSEHWRCRCGDLHRGEGALVRGRRHVAVEVLAALDAAVSP